MQHTVIVTSKQALLRLLATLQVEKDEDFIKAVVQLGAVAEDIVKANNTVDIYEEYFAGRQVEHNTEAPYAKTVTTLRDPSAQRREAQYLSWHPDGSRKLAVAYSVMGFQQLGEGDSPSSAISKEEAARTSRSKHLWWWSEFELAAWWLGAPAAPLLELCMLGCCCKPWSRPICMLPR